MRIKPIRIINLASFLVAVAINALANILPLNGQTTGDVSAQYPVLFTPAGYVFAIWGLIYFTLFIFSIYQLLPSQQDNPYIEKIGIWFALSNLFNAAWVFCWHFQVIPLSMLMTIGMLTCLLTIYIRLQIGLRVVPGAIRTVVFFPISLYLGWLSIATIANASVLLYDLNWNGFGISAVTWTFIMIAAGLILGGLMVYYRNEFVFPLVVIWAYAGIEFKSGVDQTVGNVAGAAALLLLFYMLLVLLRARQRQMLDNRPNRRNFTD